MSVAELAPGPPRGAAVIRSTRERTSAWPLLDRLAYLLCWAVGVGLFLIALAIVLFMLIKGISYLRPGLLVQSPAPSIVQSQSGGFLDPIVGSLILAVLGTAIAAPLGVAIAVWLSEYRRPASLARAVESAIEMIAGVPSVVLAIFALLIFARPIFGFLSETDAGGAVSGKSFFAAGAVMSLLALPLVVGSTREGLTQLPDRLREASYALGRTRATTIRRVLLPAIRSEVATGTVLGMGRIIGDTAIVTIVLGLTLTNEKVGHVPLISTLRGTGSTLTSYIYTNSPAGEGSAPQKAYAAAFVLLLMVLALNGVVTLLSNESGSVGEPGRAYRLLRFEWLPWTR